MLAKVRTFLEERTKLPSLLERHFDERIAGGASWAHVFGTAIVLLFAAEAFTGTLLMVTYAPSVKDAWSSVFFIEHRETMGWFVRGLHASVGNAMLLVVSAYMLQIVLYGAYKRPREVTWWLVLGLVALVLGFLITGYRLTWDQRTFWALKVEVNITQSMPVLGDAMARMLLGGAEIGQATLTRLHALHVFVLPLAFVAVLVFKHYLVRLHGRAPAPAAEGAPAEPAWPGQVVRNVAFAVLVLGASAAYVVMHGGEPLDAPAEPDRFYPARPEWFLLPLYKLRMLVPPELEVLVTGVLPVLLGGFLFGLPFVDRGEVRSVSKRIHWIGAVAGVFVVSAVLVGWSDHVDASDKKHQAHLAEARERAERSVELAMRGVPPEGPVAMMMNDPMTRGADVYKQFCTSCHVLDGEGERKSPDHDGFGSRPWILAMLKDPKSDHFFGKVEHDEKMPSQSKLGDEALAEVTEFMFSLGREEQDPPVNAALVEKGADVFEKKCVKCHMYEGEGDDLDVGGPDLTVWASRTWIMRQVRSPGGATQYGDLHKMPAFDDQLDTHDQWMVAGFLRQQRFRTAGVATGAK